MEQGKTERVDLIDATTDSTYKCSNCGNMFAMSKETCDVCGFQCSQDACQIIHSSNEDY
jgi:hypothetical protein